METKSYAWIILLAVSSAQSQTADDKDRLAFTAGFAQSKTENFVVRSKVDLPKGFGKGIVFGISNDGQTASGVCVWESTNDWKWSQSAGFALKPNSRKPDDWDAVPNPSKLVTAWNKAHGWTAELPGRSLGGRNAYYLLATGMSKDGSVVVGNYGREYTKGDVGLSQGQTIKGTDVDYMVRNFVWTKTAGIRDLWETSGGDKSFDLRDLNELSVVVSEDGRSIAFLANKLYILKS